MTNVFYFSTNKEDEVYELPLWAEIAEAALDELSSAGEKVSFNLSWRDFASVDAIEKDMEVVSCGSADTSSTGEFIADNISRNAVTLGEAS